MTPEKTSWRDECPALMLHECATLDRIAKRHFLNDGADLLSFVSGISRANVLRLQRPKLQDIYERCLVFDRDSNRGDVPADNPAHVQAVAAKQASAAPPSPCDGPESLIARVTAAARRVGFMGIRLSIGDDGIVAYTVLPDNTASDPRSPAPRPSIALAMADLVNVYMTMKAATRP